MLFQCQDTSCGGNSELVCREKLGKVVNTNLCLFPDYNKFELPIKDGVNIIDIGIDITDVLRINDKVRDIKRHIGLPRSSQIPFKILALSGAQGVAITLKIYLKIYYKL